MRQSNTVYRVVAVFMLALFSCIADIASAQHISTTVDKKQILIGEQIRYEVNIPLSSPNEQIAFSFPDSIPHFDIINKNAPDIPKENGSYIFHQVIVFTSFDSGAWVFPSLPVKLSSGADTVQLQTDSLWINVGYSPPDSTNMPRDIKPIMEVTIADYTWAYIAGAALLLLIVSILIYRYYTNRKNKPSELFQSSLSPYDEAMGELKALQKYDLDIPAEVKQYHSRYAEIFKKYFSRKLQQNMLNHTTGDVLQRLSMYTSDTALVSVLAEALRSADAVKFAKYVPAAVESRRCLELIQLAIGSIEKEPLIKTVKP